MDVHIDYTNIDRVSQIIRKIGIIRDSYHDPRYYPSINCDTELQFGYFTVMVAIDHRTSTPLEVFEGYVDGEFFHGADLLYRLGMKVFEETPSFFLPKNLSMLSYEEAFRLIKFADKALWDMHVRTFLIRDIGKKVMEYYGGKFEELFNVETIRDFAARLSIFRAYEDPVQKKIFLLAKFLEGRGLIKFKDKENYHVAVDNHLSRIALRLGIIRLDDYEPIVKQIELTRDEDIKIRMTIRSAWKEVSNRSNHDPFALDDFLWSFGRKTCTREYPRCDECPFSEVCYARRNNEYWYEHRHTLTWYY